ncbi:MAG: RluA family pseudouridine synthase [Lachnospiraceae bacterium]|nr:RluA family pseudouridine synthase [Lachnospiraceae bacterium]
MEKRYSCCISAEEAGYTVKQVLIHKWKLGTAQIKKAKFRENGILVNGKRVTVRYVLREADRLEILLEEKSRASSHLIPVEGRIEIVYEDEDLLVVEKPAGIVCHPSAGHYCDSMANLLVGYFAAKGEGYVVRLAGRLDKGTSGLLIYAKNAPALTQLERERADGRMRKTYYAILTGIPIEEKGNAETMEGVVEEFIGPEPDIPMKQRVCTAQEGGVYAHTHYRILQKAADASCLLAEVNIATGRTHQIRTHMAWLGLPLAGDRMYGGGFYRETESGNSEGEFLTRPALHAYRISLEHPTTGERMEFHSKMPADMESFLLRHGIRTDALKSANSDRE